MNNLPNNSAPSFLFLFKIISLFLFIVKRKACLNLRNSQMKTVWLLHYRHFKIFLYQHILVFIPPAVTFHRFFRHFISQKESLSVIISVICKSKFRKLLTRVLIPWNSCCLNLFWDYIMNFSTTCQFFSKWHISAEARVYYYVCSSLSNFDI